MPKWKTEQFMRRLCRHWAGQASRWPHQIHTFPDVAARRQHVEKKYSRMEGTHVAEDYVCKKDYKITRNTGFYILRQGVPEGCSSKGYTSF